MPRLTNRRLWAAVIAAAVISLPVWSDEPEETPTNDEASKEDSCIYVSGINGFNPIDNRHLTVTVGANKTYLLTLRHTCHDLKWTEDIIYDSTLTWSCTNTMDKIIVKGMSCYIKTIERVEDWAAAKALVADREDAEKD